MNFFKHKYSYLILTLWFGISFLSSCIDESIINNGETDSPLRTEGYYLTFKTSLASMTRVGATGFEEYEDYIDPKSLYLLFFYDDGKMEKTGDNNPELNRDYENTLFKKFSPGEFELVPVNETSSMYSKDWYVQIPIKEEAFAQTLRENNFKISVLANWRSTIENLQVETSSGPGDPISILHHMATPSKEGSDVMIGKDLYSFLHEDKATLGSYSDWVSDGLKEKNAEIFIRTCYGPGINKNIPKNDFISENPLDEYGKYKYGHLWFLWNFSAADARFNRENGSIEAGKVFFDFEKFNTDWASKNQSSYELKNKEQPDNESNRYYMYDWLNHKENDKYILKSFGPVVSDPANFQFISEAEEASKKIENFAPAERITKDLTINEKTQKYVGINLKKGNKDNNVIRFKMLNNGKLRIKYGSVNGPTEIKVEARNHEDTNDPNKTLSNKTQFLRTTNADEYKIFEYDGEIKITGDPEYLFIYSEKDNNGVIYEIEYISSYYLHNFDNSGRVLGEYQTIPMYGVQNFDKLTDWKPGTVFDLSNYNHLTDNIYDNPYNCKNIALIRSVAKVELKIPKTLRPHHVYLRSQNRKARSEPVDVSTPTDVLWLEDENTHPDDCSDWLKIYGHIPFFTSTGSSSIAGYQSKLAWYYGNWADNEGKVGGIQPISDERITSMDKYPHIMNAMIERTDFTEFKEVGSDSYYHRYILYVPEKYVDDPGSIGEGMETTTPKICHIEFRGANDSYDNVDDNNCYRVYFTEGGFYAEGNHYPEFGKIPDPNNNDKEIDDNWENTYEQNEENLKHHWPIIRNHVYSFTVLDANRRMVITKLEVLPWREINDNSYSW